MSVKKTLFTSLIIFLCITAQLTAITRADFEKIIDFNSNLKAYDVELNRQAGINPITNKIVLLIGTMTVVYPSQFFAFLYEPGQVLDKSAFIRKLTAPGDPVTAYLVKEMSSDIKKALAGNSEDAQISNLIKSINNYIRKNDLLAADLPTAGLPFVKEFYTATLGDDEIAFLNRLLLDYTFRGLVKPVKISVELVQGEWYGYDRVASYLGFIHFTGPDCFRIFIRRKPEEASPFMIPLNERILIAAQPLSITRSEITGKEAWLFEGLYIREIQ